MQNHAPFKNENVFRILFFNSGVFIHGFWKNQFKCFENLVTTKFNYFKLSFKFRLSFKVFGKIFSLIMDFLFQAS